MRPYQEQGAIPGDRNQPKQIPGTRENPDRILVGDLPNRSKRDRVAPMVALATQQRSSHRVSQSLLACVPCFAAVPLCQFSWFMRLLCDGISTQPSVRCSMLLAGNTKTGEDLGPHTHIEKSTNKANTRAETISTSECTPTGASVFTLGDQCCTTMPEATQTREGVEKFSRCRTRRCP